MSTTATPATTTTSTTATTTPAAPATATTSATLNSSLVGPTLDMNKSMIDMAIQELKRSPTDQQDLISQYETLKNDIETVRGTIATKEPTALSSEVTNLNNRLLDLNAEKERRKTEAQQNASLAKQTGSKLLDNLLILVVVCSFFLGGIIASHIFIQTKWFYKLFYAIYGGVFFPITLAVGLASPPQWRAPLVPLIMRGPDEPAWTNMPGINVFASMFKYMPPDLDDPASHSLMLRLLSSVLLGTGGIVLYLRRVI